MSAVGDWPSLSASHGKPTPVEAAAAVSSSGAGEDEWEMLSPNGSGVLEDTDNDGAVEVVVMPPPPAMPPRLSLVRKNSQSAPDLRELEASELLAETKGDDTQTDVSSSGVIVSNPPSVADVSTASTVVVSNNNKPSSNPWGSPNKVSFKDAIMSPSKAPSRSAGGTTKAAVPPVRRKIKTRFVVTPIKRCAKSTGDLLSLAANYEDEDEDGGEVMGATDAMEYYNRKSHGAHGRANGQKIRPDEAKRKEMIVHKKNLQRAKQKK